jgi:hypothetical protein
VQKLGECIRFGHLKIIGFVGLSQYLERSFGYLFRNVELCTIVVFT